MEYPQHALSLYGDFDFLRSLVIVGISRKPDNRPELAFFNRNVVFKPDCVISSERHKARLHHKCACKKLTSHTPEIQDSHRCPDCPHTRSGHSTSQDHFWQSCEANRRHHRNVRMMMNCLPRCLHSNGWMNNLKNDHSRTRRSCIRRQLKSGLWSQSERQLSFCSGSIP